MPSKNLTWTEFWSLCRQCEDEDRRQEWYRAIGFIFDKERNHISLDPRLMNYVSQCSIDELVDFLTGAPLQIVEVYLHKLPLKKAEKVVTGFRIDDLPILKAAYRNPPKIAAPQPAIDSVEKQ